MKDCVTPPADCRLAVRRPLSGTEGLPHLGLGQPEGQSPDLELSRKLLDFIEVDAIHSCALRAVAHCVWHETKNRSAGRH